MTDKELNALFKRMGKMLARKTIKSLLAGNDTQCFTTEQYRERYIKLHYKKGEEDALAMKGDYGYNLIRNVHLIEWNNMREVKPDVWTVGEESA